jgi:hypothetical protein
MARTGDSEAPLLLDWFHHHILSFWRRRKEHTWRYAVRLAARVWCFMNGRSLRPKARDTHQEAGRNLAVRTYQYGDALGCSQRLQIAHNRGPGVRFPNPTPTRRKHVLLGWLPEFRYVPGPPRELKRVRRAGPERGSDCASEPGVLGKPGAVAPLGAWVVKEPGESGGHVQGKLPRHLRG